MFDSQRIRSLVSEQLPDAQRFLSDVLRFPSISGQENDAMLYIEKALVESGLCVDRVELQDSLREDPDYSSPIPDLTYAGRFNLKAVLKGKGAGHAVIFNTHADVVPPSDGMREPWTPCVKEGAVYGRGACDDKGPMAALYLALRVLGASGIRLAGDVIVHVVVEEENGGNGTLAMVRAGEQADACIVLEPTEGHVLTSIRGAVWFRIVFRGRAGHSGQAGRTRSALLMARDAMEILERYHAELLAASRGIPLFDPYPNPMPLTFGRLQAGNWPASAPSHALLEGVMGFLPNVTKEQVCQGMRRALLADGRFDEHDFDLVFTYRHDSSVVDPSGPLPRLLIAAAERAGLKSRIDAMTASCDAWFYTNQLGVPTVVFGPGTLAVAHSKDEHISLEDLGAAAEALVHFIVEFCGVR